MSISFPSNPSNGDVYTYGVNTFVYSSSRMTWAIAGKDPYDSTEGGGTIALTSLSGHVQRITGSASTTYVNLPIVEEGEVYEFINDSTGSVLLRPNDGASVYVVVRSGTTLKATCVTEYGTTYDSWHFAYVGANSVSGAGSIIFDANTSPAYDNGVMWFNVDDASLNVQYANTWITTSGSRGPKGDPGADGESADTAAKGVISTSTGVFSSAFMDSGASYWGTSARTVAPNAVHGVGNSITFDMASTDYDGLLAQSNTASVWKRDFNSVAYVIEADFTLNNGAIDGAGFATHWHNTVGGSVEVRTKISDYIDAPVVTGAVTTVRIPIRRPVTFTGTPSYVSAYLLANWSTFTPTAAKNITFHRWSMRVATVAEVTAYPTTNTTTRVSSGTIIVDTGSTFYQRFTGADGSSVNLPLCISGTSYEFTNAGTGSIVVNSNNGTSTYGTIIAGQVARVTCLESNGTGPTSWQLIYVGSTSVSGTGVPVNNVGPYLAYPYTYAATTYVESTVTAGSDAQGQGLVYGDITTITTATASPSGITLPPTTSGREMTVINKSSNPVNIYPAVDTSIDGMATNLPLLLLAGEAATFRATSTTSWLTSYTGSKNVLTATISSAIAHLSNRNLIINGSGTVNQRNYVSATATTTVNQFTLDRWFVAVSGQSLTFTGTNAGRVMTAPAGGVGQVVLDENIRGGSYVLSWVGTATATINGTAYTKGAAITLPVNTNVVIKFFSGTYSQVQLEEGTTVTAFEKRDGGTELSRCGYYYRLIGLGISGPVTNGSTYGGTENFTPMRALPAYAYIGPNTLDNFIAAPNLVSVWYNSTLRWTTVATATGYGSCSYFGSLDAEITS